MLTKATYTDCSDCFAGVMVLGMHVQRDSHKCPPSPADYPSHPT